MNNINNDDDDDDVLDGMAGSRHNVRTCTTVACSECTRYTSSNGYYVRKRTLTRVLRVFIGNKFMFRFIT